MIRTRRAFLTLLSGLLFLHASSQTTKLPNTFLWRITGNGLNRPSYLLGSIHVKDRRLFYFSDSLYHFLETTDGYAMEIDPDETMAAIFKTIGEPDTSPLLKNEMNAADFKKVAKELEQKYGVPAERITKRQAWLYKKGLDETPKQKPDDMDAVIDLYLYQIAKQSGKWVGGIEDVDDQLNLIENMRTSYDASDLLESRMGTGNNIETLLQIYLAQDLTKLNAVVNQLPAGQRDTLLLKRNHKMARRMDSLAHIRSQFFTVGAAHLPGTEGVLQLLQERGFTVTPVFSKNRIAPEKYTYAKKELPWQTVSNAEKTFTIDMPGKPSLLTPDGFNAMQIYADLGTGLFYFVGAVPMAATKNTDSLLKAASKRFWVTSRLKSTPQPVVYKGIKGIEVLKDSATYTFRLRLLPNGNQLMLMIMGSEKQARLYGAEARHFYNSLTLSAPKVKELLPKEAWHRYTNDRWGIQVSFPDVPQPNAQMQKNMEKRDATHSWNFTNQAVLDAATNTYYMFIAKETRAGLYVMDDNSLFEDAKNNLERTGEIKLTRYDTGRWNSLPAMWLEGSYPTLNQRLKLLTVIQNNRVYMLMVVFDNASDSTNADFYINSLQLPAARKATWQLQTDPLHRFTTQVPQPLLLQPATDSATQTLQTIMAHDSLNAQSYYVQVAPIPAYFWTKNDSTLFESLLTQYRSEGDSLMQTTVVTAGPAQGREFRLLTATKRNTKRFRIFPNGDSVYLLFMIAPEPYISSADANLFFDAFRFTTFRKPVQLFTSHTSLLLQQLHATDSATFAGARDYFAQAPFTKDDVPQLHQAMLQLYPDWDSTFSNVQHAVLNKAIELDPEATIQFIDQNYNTLTGDREPLKYRLLTGLATIKTTAAYEVLKKLVTTSLPKSGSSGAFAYAVSDSLALTQLIYPALLAQAGDSLLHPQLVMITNKLLDSNLLQRATILPHENEFVAQAARLWKITLRDEDAGWQLYESIELLRVLNTEQSNALLQTIAKGRYLGLKEKAIYALLRNNQPVAAAPILAVAADRYNRITLYEDLKKLNKLSLFPAAYRNQKSLAESLLFQAASEDDEPSKITFIGTRLSRYNGSKKLFYLWKVQYSGASETYLGVTGPYDGLNAPINIDPDFSHVLNEPFDAAKMDTQLQNFIQQQENDE